MNLDTLFTTLEKNYANGLSKKDRDLISHAYSFGEQAHAGQTRASGESYFVTHCVNVANKIASLGFEPLVVAAGLLHDTIEDTLVTKVELEKQFGDEIAFLVNGVSKLGSVKYKGDDRHVESLRKFFLSLAKDPRVVVIKLCDRWHNLETLEHLRPDKSQRIARESIAIHAQLASRLGIGKMVTIINDLAFPYAFPEEYQKTKKLLESRLHSEEEIITKIYRDILIGTTKALGYQPHIDKRVKGLYSLYKKLVRKDWNIDEIFDIIALRIIVKESTDCYAALGTVHSLRRPVPGRVKDYIAMPKTNGYQSLHTSVFSGSGPIVEIQIRTESMHAYNEYGVASHHIYKLAQEGTIAPQSSNWLKQLGEFQKTDISNSDYMKELTKNFFLDRVFALTPKGDVIDLPLGATVLDFAYSLHSDIGSRAMGGRIDGVYKSLDTVIPTESIVEIITNAKAKPSDKWLTWVTTSHAKSKIRRSLVKQRST